MIIVPVFKPELSMYQNELIIFFAKGLSGAIVSLMTHTMESLTVRLFLYPSSFPIPHPPMQREYKLISFSYYKMSPQAVVMAIVLNL